MAHIQTVPEGEAAGPLKPIYDAAIERAGKVFGVVRLMSIKPPVLDASMQLYVQVMHRPSTLSRAVREMIATVVSRENDCYY